MTDFVEPQLLVDDRLLCKEKIPFAVVKGAQNVSYVKFPLANTPVSNQMNFNIQVPSQNTIVSRAVRLNATLRFSIQFAGEDANAKNANRTAFKTAYGSTWSFCAYPIHQAITNASVQLNDNSVSIQMNEWIAPLTHLLSEDEHICNSHTPTLPDKYGNYTIVNTLNNNPLGRYNDMTGRLHGRGSYPITFIDEATDGLLTIEFSVSEYLMFSPFLYGDYENQGFYGLNNMVFNFVLSNGRTPSLIRGAIADGAITSFDVKNADMTFCFLTNHPSQALPSPRNVVPYRNINVNIQSGVSVNAGQTLQQESQSFQLNSVPDKVWIFARPQSADRTVGYADSVLGIENISISFNNNQGLLSSTRPEELWFMSKENGMHLDWNEWRGIATVLGVNMSVIPPAYQVLTGSWLCLQFGKDIAIADDFYAPSSIGQFNFQYSITLKNNTAGNLNNYQLYTIFSYNGVLVNDRGNTIVYQSLFSKEDILNISTRPPMSHRRLERMMGQGRSGGGLSGGGLSGGFDWNPLNWIKAAASPALDLASNLIPGGSVIRGAVRGITGVGKKSSILDEYTL
jgi:hypothetical protein